MEVGGWARWWPAVGRVGGRRDTEREPPTWLLKVVEKTERERERERERDCFIYIYIYI